MRLAAIMGLLWMTGLLWTLPPARAADQTANALFGEVLTPALADEPASIVGYAAGCLRGAVRLPADGPGWQVMRPSRNRAWGHPRLVATIERLAATARREGWPGLLVGDMAQPRGGPMRFGHSSHQSGLDADIWLQPMPGRRLSPSERDELPLRSVLKPGRREVDPRRFTPAAARLIRRAALLPEVERIFVHPAIKRALCASTGASRAWLAKVRPWYGHDEHVHLRLACPPGDGRCRSQRPAADDDGCGDELKDWMKKAAWQPPALAEPARPQRMSELPDACAVVLAAP